MCQNRLLLSFIRNSEAASSAFRKMLVLPLLPPEKIKSGWDDIRSKILIMDGENIFFPLISYFEKQWIRKVFINIVYIFYF